MSKPDWKEDHFEKYGLHAQTEALCFYLDGDYIIYEIDTESVLYRGTDSYKYKAGYFVVTFANLSQTAKTAITNTIDAAKNKFRQRSIAEYIFIYENFCKAAEPIIAIALTHQYFASEKEDDFFLFLNTAINRCNYFIDKGSMYLKDNAQFDASIVPQENGDGSVTNKLYFCTFGFSDIVSFDVYRASELHISIKRCALCGKAFIPAVRSDEIYCQNKYKNGRTCSEIAFEVQSRKDPFYSLYRNAYKTESARAARMVGGGKNKLKKWRELAKEKLIEYRKLGDIEEFKNWLQNNKI